MSHDKWCFASKSEKIHTKYNKICHRKTMRLSLPPPPHSPHTHPLLFEYKERLGIILFEINIIIWTLTFYLSPTWECVCLYTHKYLCIVRHFCLMISVALSLSLAFRVILTIKIPFGAMRLSEKFFSTAINFIILAIYVRVYMFTNKTPHTMGGSAKRSTEDCAAKFAFLWLFVTNSLANK